MSLASLAVHRSGPGWLTLAAVVSLAAPWLLRGTPRRTLVASYSLGWLVVFGTAVIGRPEGDYVLATDPAGYTLMAVAFALVLFGASALPGGRSSRRT